MSADRIERETLVDAPVQRVWRLITEAEHIGTWFSHEETPTPTPANSTLVEFTLTAEGGGTRLQVAESGFAALDLPADTRAARYADHEQGWGAELGDLVEHAGQVAV